MRICNINYENSYMNIAILCKVGTCVVTGMNIPKKVVKLTKRCNIALQEVHYCLPQFP